MTKVGVRNTATEYAKVRNLSPRGALMELERYVAESVQKTAFGKTRADAAIRVIREYLSKS